VQVAIATVGYTTDDCHFRSFLSRSASFVAISVLEYLFFLAIAACPGAIGEAAHLHVGD
jgi:uncharacterized membrane protein